MECKAPGKFLNNSGLLTGTSKTKHHDNTKEKRTEYLKQSIASKYSVASRNNLLQSSHSNNQHFVPFHEEKSESKHQDDTEKKGRVENSRDIPQQFDTQIPSAAVGTASISAMDASEACQSKIQECNLSRRKSSDGTIQDFTSKPAKKDYHHIDVTSNCTNLSAERSDIKTAPNSSSSKDELPRQHKQNFVYKTAGQSSCSESKTAFPKDKSISIFAKKANIFTSQKCPSSENKSSDTAVPIRLKKCHSDSSSINPLKDDDIFTGEHKEKKKNKIETIKQNLSSVKTKMIDTLQEYSYESRNDICLESSVSSSRNTIILKLKTCPEAKADNLTDGNQDASILEKHTPPHVDLELVEHIDTPLCQTPVKKDVNQTKINSEIKNPQTDSPIEINSNAIIKKKKSSESLDQNRSPIKIRRKHKVNMSPGKVVTDNNIEISDYETLSDDDLAHTKQKRESITKCMIRRKGKYKLLKRKREQHRKERNKIKNIQEKLHKCFRGSFDPDTSESEEERDILLNYLKRRKQQSDDSLYDITSEEEVEDIFKRDKRLIHDTSADNLQEDVESAIPAKIKSNNLRDSTRSIEKSAIYETITDMETDEASICKRDTSVHNSQENIESINFDNSCDSTACTEKYYSMHDDATDEEIEDEALIYEHGTSDDSQENIILDIIIPVEVKPENPSDSSECTKKYCAIDDATTEKEASICTHDTSSNNSQKYIKSAIPVEVKSDNSRDSTTSIEKYNAMYGVTIDEEIEDGTLLCKRGTANNLQENIKSVISVNISSNNSSDSTTCIEKNYAMHDAIKDKEVGDRASVYKCGTIPNNLQENIKSKVPAKEQHIENSSIVDTENNSKSDARTEPSKDITPSMIEMDLDENMSVENIHLNKNVKKETDTTYAEADKVNMQVALANQQEAREVCNVESVDLAQCKNIQNHVTLILQLPIASANESTSYDVGKENSCDMSQNVGNLLLTCNDNITKNEKRIDQYSVTTSTSEENSSGRRHDESLSIQTTNLSISSRNSNYCDDNHTLDNHSADDNSNDIEIEIKIKPKLKSRVSQKYSLKAPWSAVNTCIKNLHTLKDNPSFLNKVFQMDHKTSKRSRRRSTSRSPQNNTLLDDNENVTVETEDCDIICDSNPVTKDNVNGSQQQQNFQNYKILSENRNTMDRNQRGRDEHMQSVNAITTGSNPELSEFACDTFDLRKQLQKVSTGDEQKINKEQNSRNNTTLEEARSVAGHNQGKENERASSIERKKTQMMTENSPGLVKAAYGTSNVGEQLPSTSSDATHSKVRVRSIAELSGRCAVNSTSLNASASSKSACSAFCQSGSFQSAFSQSAPPQSTPLISTLLQSAPLQSARLQSASPQSASLQSAPPQPIHLQLVPPQLASPQSVSERLPSYNTAVRHMYLSPRANASVEINIPNINNDLINLIQITVKNVCANIRYCRHFIRYKQMHLSAERIREMYKIIKQINQDLEKLKVWLRTNDVEYVITYVNQYNILNYPITMMEFNNYIDLTQFYILYTTRVLERNNAKSNASQHPNIGGSVPSALMPSVNAQPFSSAPFPDARVSNRGKSTQSSTISRPASTIPNINNQQLFGNLANCPQVLHMRQPTPNIHQQYTHYVPSTAHSRMPNVNQQQSLGNASHPLQGRYMPLADMSNVSSSNTNIRSCGPVNQGNANVPPATNARQSYMTLKNTISSTATVSAANTQQQKQMYFLASQINSGTTIYRPPTTNQNIPPGIRHNVVHNVTLSGSLAANLDAPRTDAAIENVRHGGANVNQRQASQQVSQASSERAQYNCYQNPNELYFASQPAHCNMQTHSVQNIQLDQNVQETLQQKLKKSQRSIRSRDTSVCSIDLTTDGMSQNMLQNVSNKRAEISESQSKDRMQKKALSTYLQQDLRQRTSSTCYVSQNTCGIAPKTSTSQRTSILQNTMSKVCLQKDNTVLIVSKSIPVSQANKILALVNFNLAFLTDIQKIVLRDQISSYFLMSDQMKYSFNEQEFERTHYERTILLYLFRNLCDYIDNIIKESQTAKKFIGKDLQDNISQNRSVLQENTIQKSVDKLTKTQSNRDTEHSSACNRNLEKQSSEKSIDLSISKNSKPTAVKNNLEARNEVSLFTPEFAITKEPLTEDTRVQEQNNDILKKKFQKNSSVDTEKRPESTEASSSGHLRTAEENLITEVSIKNSETETQDNAKINESLKASSLGHIRTPEDNSITEVSVKNLKTKAQDNTKINESLRASSPGHSRTLEDNFITEVSAKNSEMEAHDNAKINESLKVSSSGYSRTPKENSVTEMSAKNSETVAQDNAKINEFLKAASSHDKQFPELCSFAQSSLNLLQDVLTKQTEDQTEIAKSNANKKSNNVEAESIHETSNVATLNNGGGNGATSRSSYNTEDQNKEAYNASNEIPNENLQDGMHDDVNENIEILISAEIQSHPLNTSRDSVPASLNNIWRSISPIKKYESTEISQVHTAHEEHVETISECFNAQQKDSTNERSNNSTGETYNGTSDSSEKYIDENVEELQKQEQCDKVSSSEEDNFNTSQDSIWPFNTIRCDSTEVIPLSLRKNMVQVTDTSQDFVTETQNAETLNEELLEAKNILLQEISLKFEDELNMGRSTINPTDIMKKPEDIEEEDSEQSLLKVEEMQHEEMSLKFEVSEDATRTEKSAMQSIYLKLPKDIEEEKMEIDSDVKTLNEQLKHVPEQKYYGKSRTSSCNSVEKDDPVDVNIEEDSEQSLLEVEEMHLEEMSLKFEVSKDATSSEESAMQSIYLKLPKDIEEEKMKIDSDFKTLNEQLKHVPEQKCERKSRTSSCNSVRKDDPIDVNAEKVFANNDLLNADIECISVKSNGSEVTIMPSILNIRSISPSLFERMENIDTFLQSDSESLNEKDGKSLGINDNLGIPDEVDDRPCLRCKRKSTVYCQACLEAHYCSKRCSSLHWNAKHYKQCKSRKSIVCIDV